MADFQDPKMIKKMNVNRSQTGAMNADQAKSSEESETLTLRRAAGRWLRELRESQGLSQTDLAVAVGVEYYSFISQIENGRSKIPPSRYQDWANALNISARDFTYSIMQYYDPVSFHLLFGSEGGKGE